MTELDVALERPARRIVERQQPVRGVLFGVTATDPLTLLLSVSALLVAALLATSLPLLRAMRVSPVVALRSG